MNALSVEMTSIAGVLESPLGEQLSPTTTAPSPDGNTEQSTEGAPYLPPCRVCGEKASGFHYGANTCEACKVMNVWHMLITRLKIYSSSPFERPALITELCFRVP